MSQKMTPEEIAAELHKQLAVEHSRVEQLEKDKQTLIDEFTNANSLDDARELILKEVKDSLLPNALVQLSTLLQTAESESVRASIAKWSAELVITGKVDAQGNSELGNILRGLRGNDKKPQPDHEE